MNAKAKQFAFVFFQAIQRKKQSPSKEGFAVLLGAGSQLIIHYGDIMQELACQ